MELKTIKEFAHKNNLGEGLEYKNGKFQVNIDNELNTIATALTDLNENKANKDDLSTLYKIKGSSTVANINVMTPEVGWVYNLTDSGIIINGLTGEVPVDAGDNVVYTDSGWDKLSAATKIALEAGKNISIEGNIISALGYVYDEEKESFSVGVNTTASEYSSYAEGNTTTASGSCAHAEGLNTIASEFASHAEGCNTEANNLYEHAQGGYNVSNKSSNNFGDAGNTIHSIGIGDSVTRKNAQEVMQNGDHYIIGIGGYDGANYLDSQTLQEVVNNKLDKEEGKTLSSNDYTNEDKEKLSGIEAGAQVNTVTSVNGQTGDVVLPDTSTLATKEEVQAINTRIDELNIPSDLSNVVTKTDNYQVTLGTDNNPTHEKTLLVGTGLTTSNNEALIVGAYNNSEYFTTWSVDAPAIQVGAGTEDSKRTVMVVQKNGKSLGLLGFEQNGFGDFAEYFEWADGNPEGEDRVGYMVLLNEDKIELAESLDSCIGIITGTGSFVADAACLDWHGRYLKDKWGRNIYELTGALAENPDYDPTKEYIPREYRKEWSPVGLVGKILVRQDGTLKPNGFVGCVNGIATNVDKSSWRVLKVIDEEIALILIK